MNERNPAYAPGTDRIAFVSEISGTAQVWTMAPDGSDRRQLTAGDLPAAQARSYQPRWSPAGRTIVFRRGWSHHVGLFRMNAGGSGLTQLTNLPPEGPDPIAETGFTAGS